MSEVSRDLKMENLAEPEHEIVGPDYFGFYAHVVAGLMSELKSGIIGGKSMNGDIKVNHDLKSGTPLFSNTLESWVSDLEIERLKSVLKQSVVTLSQEVDEMIEPISSMCRIQTILRYKKNLENTNESESPLKKIKLSTSSQVPKETDISVPEKESKHSFVDSEIKDEEDNDNLQFLLGSNVSEVEETMKKHSDELLITIKHMENMLDKILDTVMANCRPMTRIEKQELKKKIQFLPARNLDRVVEILHRTKPKEKILCGEVHVDLEKEDTITLWRLYYYTQTVESAKKLRKG